MVKIPPFEKFEGIYYFIKEIIYISLTIETFKDNKQDK